MKPTSIDLRKRILAARLQESRSMGQIAERFGIAKGTVQNIIERYRDAGTVNPKPPNAGRKPAFGGALFKRLEPLWTCRSISENSCPNRHNEVRAVQLPCGETQCANRRNTTRGRARLQNR